jgi:predicted methyltransferase
MQPWRLFLSGCAAMTAVMLAGCDMLVPAAPDRPETALAFPSPDRPVASVVSNQFSNEDVRDERNEAQVVMELADMRPGMTVADIGAGEGYYTVRLAERVGADGRVLAQDISREALDRLGRRVERERLENISIKFGDTDNRSLVGLDNNVVSLRGDSHQSGVKHVNQKEKEDCHTGNSVQNP